MEWLLIVNSILEGSIQDHIPGIGIETGMVYFSAYLNAFVYKILNCVSMSERVLFKTCFRTETC